MYKHTIHTFRPTETIDAVLRLKGRHNLTHEELAYLRVAFNQMNGLVVPRPGMAYKIPLPFETTDDYGNTVNVPKPALPVADDMTTEAVPAPVVEVKPPEPVVEVQPPAPPPVLEHVEPVVRRVRTPVGGGATLVIGT
jgi:hypothetical protein